MGLAVLRESEHSVWLSVGTTILMIEDAAPGEITARAQSQDFVAFQCDVRELSKWRERFEGYGVALEHSTELTLYVRDPDGRRVGVSAYSV